MMTLPPGGLTVPGESDAFGCEGYKALTFAWDDAVFGSMDLSDFEEAWQVVRS
jgi:hypothetical protein